MKLLLVYHQSFSEMGYPPLKDRVGPAFEHLRLKGYIDRPEVSVMEPGPAPPELVGRVHTPRHIADVEGSGYYQVALLSTGGVVEASRKVAGGEADSAFCFVGAAGHHASREGYWGFCFINDVGVAGTDLLDSGLARRLAIVDIDPHFGDGTRDIFGPEPRVLHVNFCGNFGHSGTGGAPTNVDVTLPYDADDDLFLSHAEGALDRARDFEPDLLYVVFGYDSHHDDYGSFRLTVDAFRRFAEAVRRRFPTRVCYVLSGGARVDVGKEAIASVVDVLLE